MRDLLRALWVARRQAGWLAATIVAMVVTATATVFALNLVRPLYDRVLGAGAGLEVPHHGLVAWLDRWVGTLIGEPLPRGGRGSLPVLAVLLGAVTAKNAGAFVARYAAARLGLAVVRDLRDRAFAGMVRQGPRFFAEHPRGALISRLVNDVRMVQEALAERLGDLLQSAVTLAGIAAYLVSLSPRLTLAALLAVPVLLVPVVGFARRLRALSRRTQVRMGEIAAALAESVRAMRVVQAFGAEAAVSARFSRLTRRHVAVALRARAIQLGNGPVMETLGALGVLALLAWAGPRIAAGAMTPGDLSAFVLGVWAAYGPAKNLNQFNLALQQAAVASGRVLEVAERAPEIRDAPAARPLRRPVGGLRFEGVWFAYGGRWVLRGLDLEVPRGATVALVGRSGAGKSTVADLVLRFRDPQRGRVLVGGRDIREVTLASLRASVAMVEQEPVLFRATVRENLAAGREDISQREIEEAARAALAHEFILRLPEGYDTVLGEGGLTLSGGQRQRLAIARALLRDPEILVLDEPTSSLDAESERRIQEALRRLMAGRTVLLIAHRLATVRAADEIAVLEGGRVVERGRFWELLRRPGRFARMAAEQGIGGRW